MPEEMFRSTMRPDGDVAGVFEFDGEVGYFYLYDLAKGKGDKIKSSIRIVSGNPDFSEIDVSISWNKTGDAVGLYIKNRLWAAFNAQGTKYGGAYSPANTPTIPADLISSF